MDIEGGKEGGIILCWVGIVVVQTIDEIGTVAIEETTLGIGDEVEEEEETIDWSINVFWAAWFN